jgi:hypothetical protein
MTTTKKVEKATSKEDEGLTIKIRKFDSGQAWGEKLREEEEENEKSEWPVDSASYEFSQKRSIAKGSFGRVYIATCPSKRVIWEKRFMMYQQISSCYSYR